MNKILLASAFSSALILSACSSSDDDVAQIIDDVLVTVSGQTTNLSDAALSGVAIEGVYGEPGGLLDPKITSDDNGNFSLEVIKGDAVYLRATKDTYATINSAKAALSANETGLSIGIPTAIEAQDVITLVFTRPTPDLAAKAWLVVDIVDTNGDDVAGLKIITSSPPEAEAYPDCDGAPTIDSITVGCADRSSPMYMAYYGANTEITVTVGSETQTAPIRMGEITVLEFEQ